RAEGSMTSRKNDAGVPPAKGTRASKGRSESEPAATGEPSPPKPILASSRPPPPIALPTLPPPPAPRLSTLRVLIAVSMWIMLPLSIASFVESPYLRVTSLARDVGTTISVPNIHRRAAGAIAMTTVTIDQLTYLQALVALIRSDRLLPAHSG